MNLGLFPFLCFCTWVYKYYLDCWTTFFVICLRRELQKLFPFSSQDFPVTRIFTQLPPLWKGLILEDWVRWEWGGLLALVTGDRSLQIQNGTWLLYPLVRSTVCDLVWGSCFLCRAHCCITTWPLLLVRMKIDKNKWEGRKKSRICRHRRRWRETRWWRKNIVYKGKGRDKMVSKAVVTKCYSWVSEEK